MKLEYLFGNWGLNLLLLSSFAGVFFVAGCKDSTPSDSSPRSAEKPKPAIASDHNIIRDMIENSISRLGDSVVYRGVMHLGFGQNVRIYEVRGFQVQTKSELASEAERLNGIEGKRSIVIPARVFRSMNIQNVKTPKWTEWKNMRTMHTGQALKQNGSWSYTLFVDSIGGVKQRMTLSKPQEEYVRMRDEVYLQNWIRERDQRVAAQKKSAAEQKKKKEDLIRSSEEIGKHLGRDFPTVQNRNKNFDILRVHEGKLAIQPRWAARPERKGRTEFYHYQNITGMKVRHSAVDIFYVRGKGGSENVYSRDFGDPELASEFVAGLHAAMKTWTARFAHVAANGTYLGIRQMTEDEVASTSVKVIRTIPADKADSFVIRLRDKSVRFMGSFRESEYSFAELTAIEYAVDTRRFRFSLKTARDSFGRRFESKAALREFYTALTSQIASWDAEFPEIAKKRTLKMMSPDDLK